MSLEKPDLHIKYLHRRIENSDVYFIVNEDDAERKNIYIFNCDCKPFLLDAENGNIYRTVSDCANGKTRIKLCLPAYGSVIIVFGDCTDVFQTDAYNNTDKGDVYSILLKDNWTVNISGTTLHSPLISWSEMGFPHFSGEAVYTTSFHIEKKTGVRYFLVLEDIRDYAAVSVNGTDEIVRLWAPFRYDITGQLKNGENELKIRVVNSLDNQLYQLGRISGILGDVRIEWS